MFSFGLTVHYHLWQDASLSRVERGSDLCGRAMSLQIILVLCSSMRTIVVGFLLDQLLINSQVNGFIKSMRRGVLVGGRYLAKQKPRYGARKGATI